MVDAAERHAASHGWATRRHVAYPTRDIPAESLGGGVGAALSAAIRARLLPELANCFVSAGFLSVQWLVWTELHRCRACSVTQPRMRVPWQKLHTERLRIQDMFVAKYSAEAGGLRQLAPHEDGSEWSFVLALNEGRDYGGGGTRFVALPGKPTYRPARGHATMFAGQNRHCGARVRVLVGGMGHASVPGGALSDTAWARCCMQGWPSHGARATSWRASSRTTSVT